jgi:hypothetical protein
MKLPYTDDVLYDWCLRISTEFYELCYNDPWFKKLFRSIKQEIITTQQADFMLGCLGGPKRFSGRAPKDAHPQVWVDEDIWQYREDLLRVAMDKLNTPMDIQEKWLKIDQAFKASIINKGGPEECTGRYKGEEIIYEPMPPYLKKKAA